MHRIQRTILLNTLKLFDLMLMVGAFLLAAFLVLPGTLRFADFLAMRVKVMNFVLFLGLVLLWHSILAMFGLYHSRRMSRWRADILDTFSAVTLGSLLVMLAGIIFRIRMITLTFVLVFWIMVTVFAIINRVALRGVLASLRRRGRNLRQMLIVGTNQRAIEFARKIEATADLGYRITGFVDQQWAGREDFTNSGYLLVCDLNGLPEFLRHSVVDEVVVALPVRSMHIHAARIAALCEEQGIIIRVLPNIFDLKLARAKADEFEGSSLITHHIGMPEGWPFFLKRSLDIALSLLLLIGLAPVLVLAAILVKLTSPGPVMFTQERLGLYKRRFRIYKFRTMVADAERKIKDIEHLNEVSGPVFKIKNDPRITAIGKVLRKTSIDELPQLLNVLKGDMSLVGPRPLPVRDYEGFRQDWTRRRLSVRPGITCLWQINGRSSIPFEKWMQLDLQYIDKWSLGLDFEILIKTIPAVLKGSGAA